MRRPDLVPDCVSCAALCCVATSFEAGTAFAFDKAAGVACRHLTEGFRCAIHSDLIGRGFAGCAAYDCYGAGQRVTRALAGSNISERRRNQAFLVMREVHELLWSLTEAVKLCASADEDLAAAIENESGSLDALAHGPLSALLCTDLEPRRRAVRALLLRVGATLGGRQGAARALARSR